VELDLRYLGKSEVKEVSGGLSVRFSPNLARPKVFFDAELALPLRFREAVSALHAIVVGDLRFSRRGDKAAYQAYQAEQAKQESAMWDAAYLQKAKEIGDVQNLEQDFRRLHRLYWRARVKWANELQRDDPELFRHLVPCDPVVTVAPDTVFFECFSKDESSYGYLSVDRGAFRGGQDAGLGTTNVDYSLALFDHFQTLRTYRPTRLLVDPTGFEVKVEGARDYREEKIDLPPSWLRGFGQLQGAMALPCRRVELSVDAVYSILAYLKRHREKTGPRSLRFELTPGRPPVILIEPWGIPIVSRGPSFEPEVTGPDHGGGGPYRSAPRRSLARGGGSPQESTDVIKVWGRRRLSALARVLPLADRIEVRLLGSGLPSVWTVYMGEMRLVLALSGWTANDLTTSGSSLALLAGAERPDPKLVERLRVYLAERRLASFEAIAMDIGAPREALLAALNRLATEGQLIYDFAAGFYRYREVMPFALADAVIGPESVEVVQGRLLAHAREVKISRREAIEGGKSLAVADVRGTVCEAIFDADGVMKRAKCACSHFYKNGLRAGPCRHLLAMRLELAAPGAPPEPPRLEGSPAKSSAAARARAAGKPVITWRDRVEILVTRAIADEIEREASGRGLTPSAVVEEAWDLVFEQVQSYRSLKEAEELSGVEHKKVSGTGNILLSIDLPGDVIYEAKLLGRSFGMTLAEVIAFAWRVGRGRT
jgi:hypothetical protein